MVSVLKKSNYRYVAFALLVAAVMFLYLEQWCILMKWWDKMREWVLMGGDGWWQPSFYLFLY